MMITPADLVRWHADIIPIDRAMTPREVAALAESRARVRDVVWVLAHAVAEATQGDERYGDVRALDLVRDVARTSASAALRHAAPGQPGWREAVAAEDRRQIEQMVQILEEAANAAGGG